MDVRCDTCSKPFEATLREEPTDDGAIGAFDCPTCGTRYESYAIDREGLRLRARLARTKDSKKRRKLEERLRSRVTRRGGMRAVHQSGPSAAAQS